MTDLHQANYAYVVGDAPKVQDGSAAREALLGQAAVDYIAALEADTRVHENIEEIIQATAEEVELGLAGPAKSKADLDARFGVGRWRPLPRHVIFQDGKIRPIDNGRSAGHNDAAELVETIVCQTGEFLILAAKVFLVEVFALLKLTVKDIDRVKAAWPIWLQLVAGLEDMWKGFRQNHTTEDDLGLCVITFMHPKLAQRVYHRLFGLPFGVGSVVNQFNRMPMLITAFLRRVMCFCSGHYFDDSACLELLKLAAVSKTQYIRIHGFFGVVLSHKKRKYMRSAQTFLGHFNDLCILRSDGAMVFGCKPSTRTKGLDMIKTALRDNIFIPRIRQQNAWCSAVDRHGLDGAPVQGSSCSPHSAAVLRDSA